MLGAYVRRVNVMYRVTHDQSQWPVQAQWLRRGAWALRMFRRDQPTTPIGTDCAAQIYQFGKARQRCIADDGRMEWTFTGEVIEWRGPAPYLFVAMTPEESEDLKEEARGLIYWGQVPVHVTIGDTEFTTALFPKDGRYLVPVKAAVQQAEAIGEGTVVEVAVRLNVARPE